MGKIGRACLAIALLLSIYLIYLFGYFSIAVQSGMGYVIPFFYIQTIPDYATLINFFAGLTILAWVFWGIAFITLE